MRHMQVVRSIDDGHFELEEERGGIPGTQGEMSVSRSGCAVGENRSILQDVAIEGSVNCEEGMSREKVERIGSYPM